jgi:cation diffusion facilitator family transporter
MDNMIVDPKPTHQTISSARISLILSIVILAVKFGAYALTHSQAVFSDALESIVNVITAIIALIVMKLVAEPADAEHPYGHGKLEYFSSAFEGGMIAFAALAIAYEAVKALIMGSEVHDLEVGMVVVAVAALLNFLLGMHLRGVGKKYLSEALMASSAHVLSDVWTTVGIIVGLLLVKVTGWQWLDPAIALAVAVMLAASGVKIVRQAAGGLIDEVDLKAVESLVSALNLHRKPGLIDVHNTRIIRSGRFHHVDAHLVVPDFWDALKVHTESHDFEQKVVATYPFDGEFAFHVDPCRQEFCELCDLESCPIRLKPLVEKRALTVTSVIKGPDYGNHE